MSLDRCRVLAGRLASLLDNSEYEGAQYDVMRARAALPEDSMWKPIEGVRVREVGPGFPELSPRDYLSVGGYIIRRGGEVGRDFVNRVNGMFQAWRINASKDVVRLRPFVKDLTEAEWTNLVEVMEQRSIKPLENGLLESTGSRLVEPSNVRVERAASELKRYFGEVNQQARARDLMMGFHQHYWPHMRDTAGLTNDAARLKAEEALAWQHAVRRTANKETGQRPQDVPRDAVTVTKADREFASAKYDSFVVPQLARVAPNIEELRTLDIPGYDLDPMRVISRYAQSVRQRFAEHDMFGPRDSLHGLATGVKDTLDKLHDVMPAKSEQARLGLFVQNAFGYAPSDPMLDSAVGRFLSGLQPLKMTMSAMANASQSVNTVMRTNAQSFLKATYDLLTDREVASGIGARDMALSMGLIVDNVLRDAALYQGGSAGEAVLKYTGFTGVEKLNRMLAGYAGAVFAKQQYEAAAKGSSRAASRLKEFGLDFAAMKARGGIDFDDMLVAGRRTIDESQYVDIPTSRIVHFGENKHLRWVMQFRSFAVNQTNMMTREIQRRPARALMFGFGVMPAVGAGVEFLRNSLIEDVIGAEPPAYRQNLSPLQRYIISMATVGSFGLLSDLAYSIAMREELGPVAASRMVVPPVMSTMIDTVGAAGDVARGKFDAVGRTFMRQFGGLGSAFSRALIPPEDE